MLITNLKTLLLITSLWLPAVKGLSEDGGLSILITHVLDQVVIQEVHPSGPAGRAGLQVGDIIQRVDGISMKGSTIPAAVERMTGPVGTTVRIEYKRLGRTITTDTVTLRRTGLKPLPWVELKQRNENLRHRVNAAIDLANNNRTKKEGEMLLQDLGRMGHPVGQYSLACDLHRGAFDLAGRIRNESFAAWAFFFYEAAARQGHGRSNSTLGDFFHYGKWVEKDFKKARKYYTIAVESGTPPGQTGLANLIIDEGGDPREAIRLLKLAMQSENSVDRSDASFSYRSLVQDLEISGGLNGNTRVCPNCDGRGRIGTLARAFTLGNASPQTCSRCIGKGRIGTVE